MRDELYVIEEDITGQTCRGKLINFILDAQLRLGVALDVRDDKDRDVAIWGDFVAVITRYPNFPLDKIRILPTPVNLLRLDKLPLEGTTLQVESRNAIGTGRGILNILPT